MGIFSNHFKQASSWFDPAAAAVGRLDHGALTDWLVRKPPPTPPGVPNPDAAANAAQSQTDAMRMRRGFLANVYAGSQNQAPVVGKSSLGT